MERIAANILETIGHTPLVRINRLNAGNPAAVLAKIESRNPGGSVKDRVGAAMIAAAEAAGLLRPGAVVIEPTSGNTGIGLAVACAVKGYRLILTMPETMSVERRRLLAAYGARIVLTPGAEGMRGAIDRAEAIRAATPGAIIAGQFVNPANPAIHRATTAREILDDTDGEIGAFVAGVGTGGTLTGVGEQLKAEVPGVKIVAVEPADSAVLSGRPAGPHQLQGIGAGFVPEVLNTAIIDRIETVSSDEAGTTARRCAAEEGILIGISGGAALFAALKLAAEPEFSGKNIVVLLPDSGERYLSTWLFNGEN